MSLRIENSEFVHCDLEAIVRFIRKHNPDAAARFVQEFNATLEQLSEFPHIGRRRLDLGAPETRSWRVQRFSRYLIFYEVHADHVRILRVLQGGRNLKKELDS
jgi:plasmid stabilization system protein ParE